MNLQENIQRIKEVMRIDEATSVNDINWFALVIKGRELWKDELDKNIKIPNDFIKYVLSFSSAFTTGMKKSFENDVIKGSLSQATLDIFNNNIMRVLNNISKDPNVNAEIQKIPSYQRKLAKTVGSGKIKNAVNKAIELTGQKFFKEGFISELKETYSNLPITQNYIKVANQMGDIISKNQTLKDSITNFILSKL